MFADFDIFSVELCTQSDHGRNVQAVRTSRAICSFLGAEARLSSTFRHYRQNSMHWHRGMIDASRHAQTERDVSTGGTKRACEPNLFPENPKSWILLLRWSSELSRCRTTGIGATLPGVGLGGPKILDSALDRACKKEHTKKEPLPTQCVGLIRRTKVLGI